MDLNVLFGPSRENINSTNQKIQLKPIGRRPEGDKYDYNMSIFLSL